MTGDLRAIAPGFGRRRGLALHDRVGLDESHDHGLRQVHGDGIAFDVVNRDFHVVLEEIRLVADRLARQIELLVRFLLHEGEHVAVGEQIIGRLLVGREFLDGVRRPPALVGLHAGLDVAHVDLDEGAALAGRDELDLEHAVLLAFVLDDVARANLVCADLHGVLRIVGKGRFGGGF
jgi:hypothetical protein